MTERTTFTPDQIHLMRRTVARGASQDDLDLFVATCERTGLDPFSRQIYYLKRRQKDREGNWTEIGQIATSIDGLRVIAERSGEMDGQELAWCGPDGIWRDVWTAGTPPAAARVLLYRKGCAHPFPGVARFDEYAQQKPSGEIAGMWRKMPATMVAKCAEALALRKAFPAQLSGLYTGDELQQADNPEPTPRAPSTLVSATPEPPPAARRPADPPMADSPVAGENHSFTTPRFVGGQIATLVSVEPVGSRGFYAITFSTGEVCETKKTDVIAAAQQRCGQVVEYVMAGKYLSAVHDVTPEPALPLATGDHLQPDADIPF